MITKIKYCEVDHTDLFKNEEENNDKNDANDSPVENEYYCQLKKLLIYTIKDKKKIAKG